MTAQNFEFSARLSRIESGIGSSKSTLYVGPDDTYAVTYPRRGKGRATAPRRALSKLFSPLVLILAFTIGLVANLGTRMINLALETAAPTAENIDVLLAIDFVSAVILSSLLGLLFRMRITDQLGLRMLGIVVGMIALHNLVHLYPAQFETIMPPDWVASIITSTEPQSLLVRGVTIVI